jgi:hypothetical protein
LTARPPKYRIDVTPELRQDASVIYTRRAAQRLGLPQTASREKEMMPRMPWIIALLAVAIFLLAPGKAHAQQYSGASTSIRCRSTDGRFRHCPVNGWVRGAQLTRQISGANCAQGRSWGYDNMGVWVDRGCQAEFQVWTGGRPGGRSTVVRCSSQDGGRKTCPAGGRIGNALVDQQFSGSPCIQGTTWGFDSRNLWVTRGCRADFRVWLSH